MNKISKNKYTNKQKISKNLLKNKEFKQVKDNNNIKNSDTYFIRNLIIIVSIILSVFFIQKEISSIQTDVHWGDEVLNMLTVKNIVATGLPTYGTYANTVTSPLHFNDALTVTYWEYALELYLRAPIYLLSKIIDFKWEYYSSLIYLYLIFITLIIYYLKSKDTKLPYITIAFFILIFSISKFSSSQFHYVRYYPFTIMIMPFVHFISNIILINSKLTNLKKYLLIIFLAFLPGLFHLVNFSYLFYWFTILSGYSIYNILKNKNGKFTLGDKLTKNYKLLFVGIILIILLGVLANFLLHFLKNRLYFSSENIKVIAAFFSFYFSKNYVIYNLIFVILLIFSIINIKKFTKLESNLFISSLGFIIFCLLGFSIIGGQGIITNPYSYLMFLFPIILIIISLMLTLLFRTINNLIPYFYIKEFVIFYLVAVLFISINYKKLEENENRSDGTKKELDQLKEIQNTYKNCVFITSKNAHYFYNYFPDNKAYLLRDYANINENNIIKDDFYKSTSGYVKNIGGEIYIGKSESFCKMLDENYNSLLYFYRITPGYVDKELFDKINTVIIGNPMSAKYLQTMLCCKTDTEKIKNSLKIINEDGLLENEYISLGSFLFNKNYFNECINSCRKALAINPNNVNAYINMGVSYIKLNKWDDAIIANEKALNIDPKSETAQKNLQYAKAYKK